METQKFAYGFLGLKPKEFWELQPKDIILMQKGFEQKREYDFNLHVQTLRALRMNAYYSNTFKKRVKPQDLYPLPLDNERPESKQITQEEMAEFSKKFSRSIPKEEKFTREEFLKKINKK